MPGRGMREPHRLWVESRFQLGRNAQRDACGRAHVPPMLDNLAETRTIPARRTRDSPLWRTRRASRVPPWGQENLVISLGTRLPFRSVARSGRRAPGGRFKCLASERRARNGPGKTAERPLDAMRGHRRLPVKGPDRPEVARWARSRPSSAHSSGCESQSSMWFAGGFLRYLTHSWKTTRPGSLPSAKNQPPSRGYAAGLTGRPHGSGSVGSITWQGHWDRAEPVHQCRGNHPIGRKFRSIGIDREPGPLGSVPGLSEGLARGWPGRLHTGCGANRGG